MLIANHYIPKPGGGVAAPGESLDAARFTQKQLDSLLKSGAVSVIGDVKAPAQESVEAPAEEPAMEIDVMDGIVQPAHSFDSQNRMRRSVERPTLDPEGIQTSAKKRRKKTT